MICCPNLVTEASRFRFAVSVPFRTKIHWRSGPANRPIFSPPDILRQTTSGISPCQWIFPSALRTIHGAKIVKQTACVLDMEFKTHTACHGAKSFSFVIPKRYDQRSTQTAMHSPGWQLPNAMTGSLPLTRRSTMWRQNLP